jgi:hypothetical protein
MESAQHLVIAADILRALQSRISSLELKALGPDLEPTHLPEWEAVVPADQTRPHPPDWKDLVVPEGKHVVAPHKPWTTKLPSKKGKLPPTVLDKFIKEFNQYWILETQKNIKFVFAEEDLNFLTLTDPAFFRNRFMQKFFTDPPIILEAFGGVGGDTITFLRDFDPETCYVVQNGLTGAKRTETRSFVMLQMNVQNFFHAFPELDHNNVVYSADTVYNFILQTQFLRIDLLYLDPPWVLNGVNECTPKELVEFLNTAAFEALKIKKIIPRVICIKTRFGWDKIKEIEPLIPQYNRFVSIKTHVLKGIYFFHIFALNTPLDINYKRSGAQKQVYGAEGESNRVPIQDTDPSKPSYSNDDIWHAPKHPNPTVRSRSGEST